MNDFSIRKFRNYYQILHRGMLISTADTEHQAEQDIIEYCRMIDEYISTGNLKSQLVAIFLR